MNEPTDFERAKFMQAMLDAVRAKNGLLVSDWEMEFLSSYTQTQRYHQWFTDGRRRATDRLWQRYGPEINHPLPEDTIPPSTTPKADPGGCEYLMRDNGRQSRCNEPATLQEPGRLRYCAAHARAVVDDLKRAGKTIRLVAFNNPS